MSKVFLALFFVALVAISAATPARERRQLVNAVVDTAKSAGHGIAAVGSGLTLQGDKAGAHAHASVNRAGDALGDLGRVVYNPNG